MSQGGSILVRGGRVVSTDEVREADVLIHRGVVKAVGEDLTVPKGTPVVGAGGMLVFPGIVDSQVHFREPGNEHKEDLASGSLAAIAGGVTSFCEMPNTKPATTNPEALEDKLSRASGRCWSDHSFFLGATAENADQLGEWEGAPGCAGIKVFMGSSTGNLLVPDDETLERVLRSGSRRVAIHSEDEYRLKERYDAIEPGTHVREHPNVRDVESAVKSTTRLLNLVEKTGRKIHLLHVSTAEEIALLRERDLGELVTAELTPNHLFLEAPNCYDDYGAKAAMNPPVRDKRHQDVLREALADGTIACIGSDHAPHTLEEKARPYPTCPSGIPGVQTILPLLLTAVRDGWLSLEDVVRVGCAGGALVYGMEGKGSLEPGADGDVVIVDPEIREPIRLEWLRSRAGYSPYEGWTAAGWPVVTILRGEVAYRDHQTVGEPRGRPLRYA
ncbi:MAG: dihydroorotase [Planctomycetota bacterium]|nr:dihydroorotase [Planctomycetota bacterium]